MHFWIDKRSQACSFSGRYRVPGTVASSRRRGGGVVVRGGPGAGACKVGGLVMVTPVHRFQPIESGQGGGGVRRAHHHSYGQHRQRLLHHQSASGLQPSQNSGHMVSSRLAAETSLDVATDADSNEVGSGRLSGVGSGGMSLLPQLSGPSLAAAPQQQVLLRLPAPRHEVLAVGRLKCGLWGSFTLVTALVAAAKFYIDHKVRGSGMEVGYLVVCGFLLILLVVGCVVSMSSTGPSRGWLSSRHRSANNTPDLIGPRSALIEVPEEESSAAESLMLAQHTQPWVQQQQQQQHQRPSQATIPVPGQITHMVGGEPPPYHIAIWLPQPEVPVHIVPPLSSTPSAEVPPPSYAKATS